jgi:hypothetical protein
VGLRRALAPAVVAVMLLGLLVAAGFYFDRLDELGRCASHARPGPPWGPATALGGLAAFLAGGVLSRSYGFFDSTKPPLAPPAPAWAATPGSRLMWVPVAFLLVVFLLLAYETIGLYDPKLVWPITWHVRCLAQVQPLPTLAVTAFTSMLLGHWLWFRPFS